MLLSNPFTFLGLQPLPLETFFFPQLLIFKELLLEGGVLLAHILVVLFKLFYDAGEILLYRGGLVDQRD